MFDKIALTLGKATDFLEYLHLIIKNKKNYIVLQSQQNSKTFQTSSAYGFLMWFSYLLLINSLLVLIKPFGALT